MMQHFWFRLIFTFAALALLAWYLFAPEVLTERFDTMALGLLAIAALPWLGALVEEFKIGGVEAKLRAVREEAAEAADAAADAREVAEELALSKDSIPTEFGDLLKKEFGVAPTAKDADDSFDLDATDEAKNKVAPSKSSRTNFDDGEPQPAAPSDALSQLQKLAARYIDKRQKMSSGAMQTAAMTNIFADMQAVARTLGGDDRTIVGWMQSDDPGQQLAAIAWLRNFPAAVPPATYISLIERANQSFVQYWGIRALSGRIDSLGLDEFSIADRINLKEFESLMRAGTDRHTQIRRVNRKLAGRTPAD